MIGSLLSSSPHRKAMLLNSCLRAAGPSTAVATSGSAGLKGDVRGAAELRPLGVGGAEATARCCTGGGLRLTSRSVRDPAGTRISVTTTGSPPLPLRWKMRVTGVPSSPRSSASTAGASRPTTSYPSTSSSASPSWIWHDSCAGMPCTIPCTCSGAPFPPPPRMRPTSEKPLGAGGAGLRTGDARTAAGGGGGAWRMTGVLCGESTRGAEGETGSAAVLPGM
mmetsp:Transcript_62856/g.147935  ORF Transcript_62856/g.147935 Transcript_62856/m.147935 type:complete len:222 (-) Transcript_62856:1408-2073(-)